MKSPKRTAQIFNQEHPAPKGPREDAYYKLHGEQIEDNYVALESDSPEALAWREAQQARLAAFTSASEHHADHPAAMHSDFPLPPQETAPVEAGGKYFSICYDDPWQKGALVVRDELKGEPRVLANPNEWGTEEEPSLAIITDFKPNADGSFVILSVTHGGKASSYGGILDVESGTYLEGENFGSDWGLDWAEGKNDTIIRNQWHPEKNHSCITEHTLGTDKSNDRRLFEFHSKKGRGHTKYVTVPTDTGEPASHEFLTLHSGTNRHNGLFMRKTGEENAFDQLFDNAKSTIEPIAEVNGKLLALTDHGAPMGRVVEIDYANPAPKNWKTVIAENPERDLESIKMADGKLVANYLEDAQSKISLFELDGTKLQEVPVPPFSSASLSPLKREDGKMMLIVSGYTAQAERYLYDPETNETELFKAAPKHPKLGDDFVVERVHATSKDGTQVPMTVVRHKDVELDGSAATVLNGYGGFDIPMTPSFPANMQHFLQQGGVWVQAHLRGGGEFGADWYDQGRLGNKQNVFDDCAACAETLVDKGYTKPERLAAHGASNGGLLVLTTALQRPELFGSIVSHAPVADLMDAATWPSDYGSPRQSKEDFDVAKKYSPLQNIVEGKNYPPMLVCTATNDDIVPEHQGQKFVATMNEKSPDTLCLHLHEEKAGHYAGQLKPRQQLVDYHTSFNDFLEQTLGPIDQKQYKAAAAEWEEAKPKPKKPHARRAGVDGEPRKDLGKFTGRELKKDEVEIRRQI